MSMENVPGNCSLLELNKDLLWAATYLPQSVPKMGRNPGVSQYFQHYPSSNFTYLIISTHYLRRSSSALTQLHTSGPTA